MGLTDMSKQQAGLYSLGMMGRGCVDTWGKAIMARKYLGTALSRFGNDESGNMAMTFALSFTMICGVIGAAIDYRMASGAEDRSREIADAIALQGAVFVKNMGHVPKADSKKGLPEGDHTAAKLGFEYGTFVNQGAEGVNVNIDYDDNAKEVIVTVSGETNTTFTRILGRETVPFETVSVVSYMEIEDAVPASIALVLDNSGSMDFDDRHALNKTEEMRTYTVTYCSWRGCDYKKWDKEITRKVDVGDSPSDAIARIDGLKSAVEGFSKDLETRLESNKSGNRRVVRMGMLPYSKDTKTDWVVNMDWGYLEKSEIDKMDPGGSTNSNPPMSSAKTWMEGEKAKHQEEATNTESTFIEPLKFVVLMSDGENTVGSLVWEPDAKADTYFKITPGDLRKSVETLVFKEQVEADPDKYKKYQRGHIRRTTDTDTLASCTAMKTDKNLEIFTIGFALEEGWYGTGDWARWTDQVYYLPQWKAANAKSMLSGCASSKDHFILADNVQELDAAFDRIQNDIVEEIIRIKS